MNAKRFRHRDVAAASPPPEHADEQLVNDHFLCHYLYFGHFFPHVSLNDCNPSIPLGEIVLCVLPMLEIAIREVPRDSSRAASRLTSHFA